jgi:hypothetical protein
MDHVKDIKEWGTPRSACMLFGSCLALAAEFGSKDMVELYLQDSCRSNRCSALPFAARRGRAEMVRFIFSYRIEDWPWRFDHNVRSPNEIRALAEGFRTPDPQVWNYIVELHRHYEIPMFSGARTSVLTTCAQKGWTDMTRHLLAQGTDPDMPVHQHTQAAIYYAAQAGHTDVVRSLLDWRARVRNKDVIAAASNGHLETTRTLLSRKTIITGALVAAARGGYGDVVKLLLDHGADANEVDYGELPAIGYAIINEHGAMFRSLSQTVQAPPHRRSGRLS